MSSFSQSTVEWLEADGLGGFASGTVSQVRTRRYHAFLAAVTPPTGRMVLVSGFDACVTTPAGSYAFSSQRYAPDVVHPEGRERIVDFAATPWPTWTSSWPTAASQGFISCPYETAAVAISWRLVEPQRDVSLLVRPFLAARDYHSLLSENGACRFDPDLAGQRVSWRLYDGVPEIRSWSNGRYQHRPDWYRNFFYAQEHRRGLDCVESLAAPGELSFDLSVGPAAWIISADVPHGLHISLDEPVETEFDRLRSAELERRANVNPLDRAADQYLVRRGRGRTIVAGYPWFTDWGRDTFISLPGLCLSTGRLDDARDILLDWSGQVSEGMLPNRFPDRGDVPEYNSVDASLWFIVAVYRFRQAMRRADRAISTRENDRLNTAIVAILTGYAAGTRFGIRLDDDGLLAAGQPGVQLTWMDAKVGDWVVTPRIGKPVEIQALWLNALWIARSLAPRCRTLFKTGHAAFQARFWNAERGCLFDVVDVDHRPGAVDPAVRPNQLFAVGGLPIAIVCGAQARSIVAVAASQLWTPVGVRTLAPGEPNYATHFRGGIWERDGAYHQGTVWPWLTGALAEAWVRVQGRTAAAREEARRRFLVPLKQQLSAAGVGHLTEVADAEQPHASGGCPFQAWSLAELLRLDRAVFAEGRGKAAIAPA